MRRAARCTGGLEPMAPTVATESGRVRGSQHAGIARFLAVPYAAAPVAARRFCAPMPHPGWEGVRDATARGPNAPQVSRPFPNLNIAPVIGSGWRRGDEFLTANVWTPDPGARNLPVAVFIHGGACVAGENDAAVHDGTRFARSGIVCIAINYRLGVEGFLPIPGVPTNLGLRDQIAALEWVRRNAAAFGGNPDDLTVFGESAGAMCIANLLESPLAKGLFRRAIVQSGHGSMVRSRAVGSRLVDALAVRLGVPPNIDGFRTCSEERCLAAIEAISRPGAIDLREADGRDPTYGLTRFLPIHGDDVLPEPPLTALARGAGAEVELMIGTNREEMNLYFVPTGVIRNLTDEAALAALQAVEPQARAVLEDYRAARPDAAAGAVYADATTDLVFRWPARRFAAAHRGATHVYEFEWRSNAAGGELGACHAVELPFVFDTLASCTGADGLAGDAPPQDLADRVHRLWVDFMSGRALPWAAYDPESRNVRMLARDVTETEKEMLAARHP
jgi:para-nitrobenzyl esterase